MNPSGPDHIGLGRFGVGVGIGAPVLGGATAWGTLFAGWRGFEQVFRTTGLVLRDVPVLLFLQSLTECCKQMVIGEAEW